MALDYRKLKDTLVTYNSRYTMPGIMFNNIYGFVPIGYTVYLDNVNPLVKCIVRCEEHIDYGKIEHCIDYRSLIETMLKMDSVEVLYLDTDEVTILGKYVPFLIHLDINPQSTADNTDVISIFCEKDRIDDVMSIIGEHIKPNKKTSSYRFGIATMTSGNIYTAEYDYFPKSVDIDMNYNDDFKVPYEKIHEVIEKENETGLVLLYGEPGTGKTTVIKNLISEYPKKNFVFIDGELMYNTQTSAIVTYFLENSNTVFILEDCEKILKSREDGYNPIINTLLNITDGIMGDVLNIKMICTFNTSIDKIDKAMMRKGRLSLKYEFKPLTKEKASRILGYDVDKDMTLADIYNINNENDYSKKEKKTVGFKV